MLGVFGVMGACGPFEVIDSVVGADFVFVIDDAMEWRGLSEESFSHETVRKFCDLKAVFNEADVQVAVMYGCAAEELSGGFVSESTEGGHFIPRKI